MDFAIITCDNPQCLCGTIISNEYGMAPDDFFLQKQSYYSNVQCKRHPNCFKQKLRDIYHVVQRQSPMRKSGLTGFYFDFTVIYLTYRRSMFKKHYAKTMCTTFNHIRFKWIFHVLQIQLVSFMMIMA